MFCGFAMTAVVRCVINDARNRAQEVGDREVRPDHLLWVLLEAAGSSVIGEMLEDCFAASEVTLESLEKSSSTWVLEELVPPSLSGAEVFVESPDFDAAFVKAMMSAASEARVREGGVIDLPHLLIGVALEPTNPAGRFLAQHGADYVALRGVMGAMDQSMVS